MGNDTSDFWRPAQIRMKKTRQLRKANRPGNTQPTLLAGAAEFLLQPHSRSLNISHQSRGFLKEKISSLRQLHLSSRALEQCQPKASLHPLDLAGYRALSETRSLSRAGETLLLRHEV